MLSAADAKVQLDILLDAYRQMCYVAEMARVYDEQRKVAKYVHSTSRGHEAIQLAASMILGPEDYIYPYYRDEAVLLGVGMQPYELMLQLLAKRDDPFSGGRMYYAHPSLRDEDKTKIPFQSSATGMQIIPATGAAHGLKYKENEGIADYADAPPVIVCSLGDGAITEGEASEAMQMAVLHQLPIVYLVQDNDWGISATGQEMRAMDAVEFAQGFKGLETRRVDGRDFIASYQLLDEVYAQVRNERRPFLVHAEVPLLHHHTSGVRHEFYRDQEELKQQIESEDPRLILRRQLLEQKVEESQLSSVEDEAKTEIEEAFERAKAAPEPEENALYDFYYYPTPITEETGTRTPEGGSEVVMVDAALHAMDELMRELPESLLYGQDVGGRLGGVFREAATLASKYGDNRVFNTPIQEAYIIGSTSGMSAVGCKPVVEVQFADYIWPGLNQLFTELSRTCYLSYGKWPAQSLIRVPIGAYGGGGPFHSSSVESVLLNIRGVKVVYPSNAADLKGLFKAAFHDPNPVVMLEHKGLYWSKVPGTKRAMTIEPDSDYVIPLGQARVDLEADPEALRLGDTCGLITYGMGVHWARNAVEGELKGRVEILDLRSLEPLDWDAIEGLVRRHNKVLLVTEEPIRNGFMEALAGRIGTQFFELLDAPVQLTGSADVPGIPVNEGLEKLYLPGKEGVQADLQELLAY